MAKSGITRTWIGGLIVFGAGILVALFGVFVMLALGGTFTQRAGTTNQYDFTPALDGTWWTGVAVLVTGGVVALAGSIVQLAAWVGALINSYGLPEKTWFLVLLIGGLLSLGFPVLGFAAMLAYVIAAPEGSVYRAAPTKLVPTAT